jgi:Hypothetical protein (DUF2513)
MKRDMDLIRKLLLAIETDPRLDGMRVAHFAEPADLGLGDTSTEEVRYQLTLLMEAGFIDGKPAAEMPISGA